MQIKKKTKGKPKKSAKKPIKQIIKPKKRSRGVALSVKDIVSALEKCIDPELGVNLVDLGFVYGIDIKGDDVVVKMTLSSPMCPLSGMITDDVNKNVGKVKGVKDVTVEMVWDPPWSMEMMSDKIRKQLSYTH